MKKRKFINKKLIAGILTSSLLLSQAACSTKKDDREIETEVIIETIIVTATPTPTERIKPTPTLEPTPTPEPTTEATRTLEPTPIVMESTENTPPTEYHSADSGLNATLDSIYNRINYINYTIDNIDYNEVKEDTIEYAKDLIDFIFYGAEMNGITFDELKDDAKEAIYAKLQIVDAFIMQFIPDYKERIGEKYNLVKDFTITTLEEAKEIFSGNIDIDVDIDVNVNTGKGKAKLLKISK